MKMISWNDLSLDMSLLVTNNDVFQGLLNNGCIPTDHNYHAKVYDYIKWNILDNKSLSCREEEWLLETTNNFCIQITSLWKENQGIIIQSDPFMRKVIWRNIEEHSCSKCLSSAPRRNKKIKLIPSQVRQSYKTCFSVLLYMYNYLLNVLPIIRNLKMSHNLWIRIMVEIQNLHLLDQEKFLLLSPKLMEFRNCATKALKLRLELKDLIKRVTLFCPNG